MFALYVVAFVCWVSASSSAPPSCQILLQPVEKLDFNDLKGMWALVLATYSNPVHLEILKRRDSAGISFTNHSGSSEITFTRVLHQDDSCQYMQANITLGGSGFSFSHNNVTMTFLHTSCLDCVAASLNKDGKTERFYLFSRRREVEAREAEEFKAQAECLSMPAPVVMDPTKELCPEQVSRDSAPTAGQDA
uniref:Apolipoprotein M n=2 Tax=Nothobranchius furzeri TaxID=105023 RepID=A0A8C6LYE5_NOTFU